MSYRDLYDFCNGLNRRPIRWEVIDKVVALTGRGGRPGIQIVGYDPTVLRGLIMWFAPDGHPMARRCNGEPLIQIARDLSKAWQRFVLIKEMMHYFDSDLEKVGTAEEFAGLINEISSEKPNDSIAMRSEVVAIWRALAVLCPESLRQEYQRRRAAGEICDEDIARQLKLPVEMVVHLFDPQWKQLLDGFLLKA